MTDSASSGSDREDAGVPTEERRGSMSLKRGRAESLEPPVLDKPTSSSISKKNRLGGPSTGQAPSKPMDPDPSPNIDLDEAEEGKNSAASVERVPSNTDTDKPEGQNVGEVRRKVEEMTYEEGKNRASGDNKVSSIAEESAQEVEVPAKDGDKPDSAMSLEKDLTEDDVKPAGTDDQADDEEWQTIDKSEVEGSTLMEKTTSSSGGPEGLKRKAADRSESSQAVDQLENQVKRHKDTPSPKSKPESVKPTSPVPAPKAPATSTTAPASDPPKKPQSSFASFSSTSSPFASARTGSPFASASSTPGTDGAAGSSASGTPKPSIFGGNSGFGGYSSTSSPFAKAQPKSVFGASAKDSNGSKEKESGDGDAGAADEEGSSGNAQAGPSTFGDILKADSSKQEEDEKVHMTEQDVHTGEEGESSVFTSRTKLYVMQADGGWRERGVGLLKLNVRRDDRQGARLVMRADGVLRLILNVSLYVGMSCLEDGKHVRTTVIEDGERKFVTFRTGSNKAASELASAILEYIPLESANKSKSPDPAGSRPQEDV